MAEGEAAVSPFRIARLCGAIQLKPVADYRRPAQTMRRVCAAWPAFAAAFRLDFARPATHTPARHAAASLDLSDALSRFDIRHAVRGMTP
jgi:hypothetical protein